MDYPNRFQRLFELKEIERLVLGEHGEIEWSEFWRGETND